MKTLALLALLTFLPQQSNTSEKIALVFGPEPERIEFADRADSERLYEAIKLKIEAETATEEDLRLHAALTVALGTKSKDEAAPELNTRERLDWEIRRGVRPPLQKPDRGGN